ncbi:hypothetical protein [Vibrio phage vB_pir03]|nr:hypothetical protein [Vibrio phage vB_pir03]
MRFHVDGEIPTPSPVKGRGGYFNADNSGYWGIFFKVNSIVLSCVGSDECI